MQPLATREEYWGNNYLPRNDPAAFDILYWNSDTTRLPAALHSVYPDLYHNSPLLRPGALRLLGTLIDLGKVQCDTFILAAMMDHVTPWQACCATTRMLGGQKEFVLSSSGHIQSVITLGKPQSQVLTQPETGRRFMVRRGAAAAGLVVGPLAGLARGALWPTEPSARDARESPAQGQGSGHLRLRTVKRGGGIAR